MMFHPSESFDLEEMAAFMRRPDIYGPVADALAPPAEAMQFEDYMMQPTTWTLGCMYGEWIIGYVQIVTRTSVAGELTAGFHPQARGVIAKRFIQHAIDQAWGPRGLLTIWAFVPSDNLPSRRMVSSLGFQPEGRLRQSMVRIPVAYRGREAQPPGLYDLITYAIHKGSAAS